MTDGSVGAMAKTRGNSSLGIVSTRVQVRPASALRKICPWVPANSTRGSVGSTASAVTAFQKTYTRTDHVSPASVDRSNWEPSVAYRIAGSLRAMTMAPTVEPAGPTVSHVRPPSVLFAMAGAPCSASEPATTTPGSVGSTARVTTLARPVSPTTFHPAPWSTEPNTSPRAPPAYIPPGREGAKATASGSPPEGPWDVQRPTPAAAGSAGAQATAAAMASATAPRAIRIKTTYTDSR